LESLGTHQRILFFHVSFHTRWYVMLKLARAVLKNANRSLYLLRTESH